MTQRMGWAPPLSVFFISRVSRCRGILRYFFSLQERGPEKQRDAECVRLRSEHKSILMICPVVWFLTPWVDFFPHHRGQVRWVVSQLKLAEACRARLEQKCRFEGGPGGEEDASLLQHLVEELDDFRQDEIVFMNKMR